MKLKQKPSGIFFVEEAPAESPDGNRRRVSLDTKDPADAREQFRQWKLGVHPKQFIDVKPARRSALVRPAGMTLAQGLDKCMRTAWAEVQSQGTYRSYVKKISESHGETLLVQITADWLETYKAELRAAGYALGTVKGYVDAVCKVLKEATKWDDPSGGKVLQRVPEKPEFKLRNRQNRVVSHEEEAKIYEVIEGLRLQQPTAGWALMARFVRFLVDTGCRLNEALSCRSHLITEQWGEWWYDIPEEVTKSDKARMVPLSARVVADLPWLKENAANGYLFPMNDGKAQRNWMKIREAAGLPDVKLHTFRHTCATRLVKGGLDIYRVQKWLGHADIAITAKRYAHLGSSDLVGGLSVLNANPAIAGEKFPNPDVHYNGTSSNTGTSHAIEGTLRH